MRLLVVGGAGYIGSHMCKMLAERGDEVIVCDDLSTGHREAVQWGRLIQCPLDDAEVLNRIFEEKPIDGVLHFAAHSVIAESVQDPLKYYDNNVGATIRLLQIMRRHGVERFVFSSTASVFGEPQEMPISELHPTLPVSPYGATKLAIEQALEYCAQAYGMRAVSLRYFNAAGADSSGRIGEVHNPEPHLIPRLLRLATGEPLAVQVFGDDYPTADGTCIRDYIHVNDLCDAHVRALDYMSSNAGFHTFNLGNGAGYSVRQVIDAVERVIGQSLNISVGPRRLGDPARLVASHRKASDILGWMPKQGDIESIIASAWHWHCEPKFGLPARKP